MKTKTGPKRNLVIISIIVMAIPFLADVYQMGEIPHKQMAQ